MIEVTNHIYNEYRGEWFRWQHIFLGLPTTAPHSVGSSRWGSALAQGFEKGIIYDRGQDATTFTVRGDILGEYKRVNSYMSCLGFPTDNERDSRIQHFQGGSILQRSL